MNWNNTYTDSIWVDELPALGQSIDPPRRATPTLPPGLFPDIEQQPVIATEPLPPPARVGGKSEERSILGPAIEALREKVATEDKGKSPHIRPATPIRPAARDPTPAESATSMKDAKSVPVKAAAAKAVPQTPTQNEEILETVKAKPAAVTKPALEQKPEEPTHSLAQDPKTIPEAKPEASTSKRPHPGRLNLDTTPASVKDKEVESPVPSASSKPDLVGRLSRAPSVSATSLSSRPGTPLASAITTGSPFKRAVQPRTIRITDTPRTETPPALPSVAAVVAAAASTPPPVTAPQTVPNKVMSRRTSIASLNQPGTPLTERTDTMSVTSTSVSRANSPPPVLSKAKSKKKDKSKKEKAAQVEAIIAPKESPAEEVAPIMARKTKSKKSKPAREGPTPVSRPTPPPAIAEEKVEPPVVEASPPPASPVEVVKPEPISKGKAKSTTTTPTPTTPPPRDEPIVEEKVLDSPSPLTAAAILQALESTHQLAVSTLNLLKPLASQSELKKLGIDPFTSADLQNHIEQLRFELTKADEQLLKQGQAVRKDLSEYAAKNGRVSGRCFVTPAGTRLSCLTKEEEDKYLEIERRVMAEKGISRWGGAGASHITKQALKPKKGKLQNTLAQEDILRALSIATESLEGALRDATKGSNVNVKVESHIGPASAHLAGQTVVPPTRADGHPQDPTMDAREYVNKFVPRLLDANPNSVAVPPTEDEIEDQYAPGTPGWNNRRFPVHHSGQTLEVTPQLLADATAAAGLAPRPELNLPPPSPHIPVPSSSSMTDANTAAAMDTLKEAMATAGAIAKLGASEALKSPAEILKNWEKAGAAGGTSKNLQAALEKAVRREASSSKTAGGAAMSMADLEREGLRERIAEAKRDVADYEKKFNKVVRGNRKLALGGH